MPSPHLRDCSAAAPPRDRLPCLDVQYMWLHPQARPFGTGGSSGPVSEISTAKTSGLFPEPLMKPQAGVSVVLGAHPERRKAFVARAPLAALADERVGLCAQVHIGIGAGIAGAMGFCGTDLAEKGAASPKPCQVLTSFDSITSCMQSPCL